MKNFRPVFIILLGLILLSLLGLGALWLKGKNKPKIDKLVIWGVDEEKSLKAETEEFKKENPAVSVQYRQIPAANLEFELLNALAAEKGPDIVALRNDWIFKHHDKLVPFPKKALQEKRGDKRANEKVVKETFPNVVWDELSFEGNLYALPLYIDTLSLFYNTDKIKTPPTNWTEVLEQTKKASRPYIALGALNVDHAQDIFSLLLLQNQADPLNLNQSIVKASGEVSKPGLSALEFLTSFAQPGKETFTWDKDGPDSFSAFGEGKVPLMLNYTSAIEALKNRYPTLNFKTSEAPQIKDAPAVNLARYYGLGATKDSKDPALAREFLKLLLKRKMENKAALSAQKFPKPDQEQIDAILKNALGRVLAGQSSLESLEQATKETTDLLSKTSELSFEGDTLNVWRLEGEEEDFRAAFKEFQTFHKGVKINYQKKNKEFFEMDFLNALAAGKGPDVLSIPSTWLPAHQDKFIALGAEFLPRSQKALGMSRFYKETFIPLAFNEAVLGEKAVGFPLLFDSLVLYYNQQMAEQIIFEYQATQNPLSVEDKKLLALGPATWDDLVKINKLAKLAEKDKVRRAGVALGEAGNIKDAPDILSALMLQRKIQMVSPDKKMAAFHLPVGGVEAAKDAVEFYRSFAEPKSENYTWNDQMPEGLLAFRAGQALAVFGFKKESLDLGKLSPNLSFKILPFPQPVGALEAVDFGLYTLEGVTKKAKDKKLAFDLVYSLTTQMASGLAKALAANTALLTGQETPIQQRVLLGGDSVEIQKSTAQNWYKIREDSAGEIFQGILAQVKSGKSAKDAVNEAAANLTVLMQLK
ncbi:extracellular solute-binding protein [Candidatus Berkelbacteria bacterium]|nr:extracellular solute-binding protein [Candidatus Berkelbacteria bacterium]